jgi:hypothetical protein
LPDKGRDAAAARARRLVQRDPVMIISIPRSSSVLLISIALALIALPAPSRADNSYQKFVGEYLGEGISDEGGHLDNRDLAVEIKPSADGFILTWVSVTHKENGTLKRKSYSVHFKPKGKSGLYGSAMRKDMFGNQVPMDPLEGDPYVWARISGDTLFVYALLITDEGGYEMQVYERTLTADGMELVYSRVRDGGVMRTVRGTLKRVN